MARANFHFNGGPEGGSLATNNKSRNGDVFNTVTTYKTITIKAASAFHGLFGCQYANTTADWGTVAQWTVAPQAGTYLWSRTYVRIDRTNPTNIVVVANWEPALYQIAFGAAGKFVVNKSGILVSSTMSYAANTWYRVESMIYVHASAGQVTVRVYAGDSTPLLEEFADSVGVSDEGWMGPYIPPGAKFNNTGTRPRAWVPGSAR
jgi:hypothetical protein